MKAANQFWQANDQMLLSDWTGEAGPQDRFKNEYKAINRKQEIPEKPTTHRVPIVNKLKGSVKHSTNERWTSVRHRFGDDKGTKTQRLFDTLAPAHEERQDFDPMFSSFTANNIFVAPPSSSEALE